MPLPPAHLVERPCADAAHAELPRERVLVAEALRVVVPDLTKSGVSEHAHAPPRVAATHKFVAKKLGNVESKQGLAKAKTLATYRHRMREIGMRAYIVMHCHRYLYRQSPSSSSCMFGRWSFGGSDDRTWWRSPAPSSRLKYGSCVNASYRRPVVAFGDASHASHSPREMVGSHVLALKRDEMILTQHTRH